ncbi:hypothetical protein E4T56_gene19419 [Termitomyces sp. T112]|nr:hypothetical protein E4T56_gene19419 [Termitomyces sp. T112]KAH0583875.1 hypothetical protein H2248_009469 [Termitomyces sp. 'cryptogamus']
MTSKPRISLRLSAKPLDIDHNSQFARAEPPNRKRTKRLVLSDDESSDQDPADSATSSSPHEHLTQRLHTSVEDSGSELTEPEPEPEPEPESGPSPLSQPSSSSLLKRTQDRKLTDGPPAKKKRVQQESSDEEYHNAAPSGDDDNLIIHTKRQSKLTAKAQAIKGKSKSFSVGERKAGRTQQSISTEATRKAKTKRTREVEDDPVDVVNDTETRPDTRSPSPPKETVAPPAKRRKYPTIKKNKGAGATTDAVPSSKTSSNVAIKSAPPKAPDLPKPTLAGSRVPPMMVGKAELDLRDESVYKAIFNQSGGNTPRSGLARQRKEEERRKELDKMRDEAREKRLSEMIPSFDLQTQYEKIKRFEETLGRRSLFPNVLAAAWRDLYDTERKKAFMEQTRTSGGNSQRGGSNALPP